MKKVTSTLLSFALAGTFVFAQEQQQEFPSPGQHHCATSEKMEEYYAAHPEAKAQHDALEIFTQQFVAEAKAATKMEGTQLAKYRIPVVFHVYGNNFWGKALTDAQIIKALAEVNKDFQGLSADFATVNNNFSSIKSTLDISFELAKKDPNGNVTTGIDRKNTTGAGYGNPSADSQVAKDAWDCKKYFNVYIVADLYNDGTKTNSGVCWYPNVSMTNSNTARCVYNGQYLGTNSTNVEFRSVLTHEFGHFLNLIHTFDGGCNAGDNVSDTPAHSSTTLGCPSGQNTNTPVSDCGNWVINSENFMDYNGCSCGYKNFTKGQVTRMDAALNANDVTRKPLWQTSNLIATGLLDPTALNDVNATVNFNVYPNPSNNVFFLEIANPEVNAYQVMVTDILGNVVYSTMLTGLNGPTKATVDLSSQSQGVYLVSIMGGHSKSVLKLIKN